MESKTKLSQTALSVMQGNSESSAKANAENDTRRHDTSLDDRIAEAKARQGFNL